MGTKRSNLRQPVSQPVAGSSGVADALFTPVQQRVLALVFGQPERRFQSAELIRLAASGTGAVHRFLTRLESTGLVTVTTFGNQKHYQANRASPVFGELQGLVLKTVGVVEPLKRALAPFARRIRAAFVYGSIAKGTERATSDIDLLVVSDKVSYAQLYEAIQPAERELARSINPTAMTLADWRARRRKGGSLIASIMNGPRMFIVGGDDELE